MGIEALQDITFHPVSGVVGSNGIQYSSVASFGTTAVEVFNQLLDPGVSMGLRELEFGTVLRFIGQNGSLGGTLAMAYWEARSEAVIPTGNSIGLLTGAWVNLTGTQTIPIGTLATVTATYAGYVPIGSIPFAPVRIRLTAVGDFAKCATAEVRNETYVTMKGIVIPGT